MKLKEADAIEGGDILLLNMRVFKKLVELDAITRSLSQPMQPTDRVIYDACMRAGLILTELLELHDKKEAIVHLKAAITELDRLRDTDAEIFASLLRRLEC